MNPERPPLAIYRLDGFHNLRTLPSDSLYFQFAHGLTYSTD